MRTRRRRVWLTLLVIGVGSVWLYAGWSSRGDPEEREQYFGELAERFETEELTERETEVLRRGLNNMRSRLTQREWEVLGLLQLGHTTARASLGQLKFERWVKCCKEHPKPWARLVYGCRKCDPQTLQRLQEKWGGLP